MYSAFPGQYNSYGAPGGGGAPGTGAPPGTSVPQQDAYQQGRPAGFPSGLPAHFQPPANLPNINFAAPVIRLGGPLAQQARGDDRSARSSRPGLGSDSRDAYRDGGRDRPQQPQQQSKEEIIRTVFVGGITEGCGGDYGIERIMGSAGRLARWFRARDADDKPCSFGFAEFEDPESLAIALEILVDVNVPVKMPKPERLNPDGEKEEDQEDEKIERQKLLIVADELSHQYLAQYEDQQNRTDATHREMLVQQARQNLQAVLQSLEHPQISNGLDGDGDIQMREEVTADGDVVTIPIGAEDELVDIPAELREVVAVEIKAFRDRSNKRDIERMKREEEMEREEKHRMMNGGRDARSPPRDAPSGPGGTNGIPVGPRGSAPTGPRNNPNHTNDFKKSVTFVNGVSISAASAFEHDDTDASDEELEKRRKAKKESETDNIYFEQERRWLNRERSRAAALDREKGRDQEEVGRQKAEQERMRSRLKEWNDDVEKEQKVVPYYSDHSSWVKNRSDARAKEAYYDDQDRMAEDRENGRGVPAGSREGRDSSDRVDNRHLGPRGDTTPNSATVREPARFKLALGAAAQKQATTAAAAAASSRRVVADVEGLLEDEEQGEKDERRQLTKIDPSMHASRINATDMTESERQAAAKQLAAEIPTQKDELWAYPVQWSYLDSKNSIAGIDIVEERLRPFLERKLFDFLGVQEDLLVTTVVDGLKARKSPDQVIDLLAEALGDEESAEDLVKKLWRMVVFFSESERRGLGN